MSAKPSITAPDALPLFPTFVWQTRLPPGVRDPLNRRIADYLGTVMPTLEQGQAWQSSQDLHRRSEFERLVEYIHETAAAVLEFLRTDPRELQVTACWATVNAPRRGHRAHAHPNSFLSGVYYVQTQEGANRINFHDPRSQVGVIRPPVTELTAANADQAVIEVSDGTMLLFPSWLQHSVDANSSPTNRMSVSFNMMFSAYTERLCRPLWGDRESSE